MYRTLYSATWAQALNWLGRIAPTAKKWLGWKDYSALRASPLRGRPSGVILPRLTHPLGSSPVDEPLQPQKFGWGGRIRTSVWRDQNPLPYRLATPQLGINNQRNAQSILCRPP